MGHVKVQAADLEDGSITALRVKLHGLPPRTIDRETAVAWMKDGHSLVPVPGGSETSALQLVEVPEGDESKWFIRVDNAAEPADTLPDLPPVERAGS